LAILKEVDIFKDANAVLILMESCELI